MSETYIVQMTIFYIAIFLGDITGHIFMGLMGLGGYGRGQKNLEERILVEICLEKCLCVSYTWSNREVKRKVTFRMGEKWSENDLVSTTKEHQRFFTK